MSKKALIIFVAGISALAQSPTNSAFDSRLAVSTIVREDIFAGVMANDNERLLRGEKNIELLLVERPQARAQLAGWKAFIALKRAVDAHESKRTGDFEREYRKALDLYTEAAKLGPADFGVMAITGGSYSVFGDRLPEPYRRDAWNTAYKSYSAMWKVQESQVDKFPLHIKGELLGGMAQSAQRSGHADESARFVEKILTTMPGTAYAAVAKKWTDSPDAAAKTNLTCHSCHDSGRLEARKASLAKN